MSREDAGSIYVGSVMHARLRPFRHRFVYRVFTLLVDLDALDDPARRPRLLARNRFGLFSIDDRDHGRRDGSPLRPWVEAALARAGIDIGGGPVRMLCFPRILGYVFNPLTIYWCHDRDDRLRAVLYEVKNTFGDQHGYLVPVDPDHVPGAPVEQRADKGFYVSPFIGMASTYRFRLNEPGEDLSVVIRQSVPEGPILVATLDGRRRPLSDAGLLRMFVTHPLMTVKVIGAIHWEAARLWLKGARFHRWRAPPETDVTIRAGFSP
jgi:uncharacterized protein